MKYFSLFLLSIVLFVGLSYAGKAFFGMNDGMQMGSIECANHCIDSASVPGAMSSPLTIFLFAIFSALFVVLASSRRQERSSREFAAYKRRTEPIGRFLLKMKLSPVMLRD